MSYYSTEVKNIDRASFDLIVQNAETLIKYIYNHKQTDPYNRPEIRVGLVIKILLKSNENYGSELIQPVIEDIEMMMEDKEYLASYDDSEERHLSLSKELSLLNKFKELDDTISLNTTVRHEVVSSLI